MAGGKFIKGDSLPAGLLRKYAKLNAAVANNARVGRVPAGIFLPEIFQHDLAVTFPAVYGKKFYIQAFGNGAYFA